MCIYLVFEGPALLYVNTICLVFLSKILGGQFLNPASHRMS